MVEEIQLIFLFLIAIMAGGVDAFGGGGGLLTLPGMMAFGISPHFALGTNALLGMLGSWDTLHYIKKKQVLWTIAVPVIVASFFGAFAGAKLVLFIPEGMLEKAFAVLLPLMGWFLFRGKVQDMDLEALESAHRPVTRTGPVGFLISFYDAVFPPGSGIVKVLFLRKFLQLRYMRAIAISRVACLITFATTLAVYSINGNVLWSTGLIMALGYGIGSFTASHMALKGGEKIIRRVLIGLFTGLTCYLIYQSFLI